MAINLEQPGVAMVHRVNQSSKLYLCLNGEFLAAALAACSSSQYHVVVVVLVLVLVVPELLSNF